MREPVWKPRLRLSAPTPLIAIALVLLAQVPPVFGGNTRINSGALFESYSFADMGHTEWAEAAFATAQGFSILGRGDSIRRFNRTDLQGTIGAGMRLGKRTGIEGNISLCPGAEIAPRFSTSWFLYRDAGKMQLIPQYRFSSFETADIHLMSAGVVLPVARALESTLRVFASATRFKSGTTEWNSAFFAQLRFFVTPDLSAAPSYSYASESFEAGAQGETGKFRSRTVRLEGLYKIAQNFSIRAAGEYENRSVSAFVRRYDFGFNLSW